MDNFDFSNSNNTNFFTQVVSFTENNNINGYCTYNHVQRTYDSSLNDNTNSLVPQHSNTTLDLSECKTEMSSSNNASTFATITETVCCHFTCSEFISSLNDSLSNRLYFCGNEITDKMWSFQLPNVKIPIATHSFNIAQNVMHNSGFKVAKCIDFTEVMQLCVDKMNQKKYGELFGSVMNFQLLCCSSQTVINFPANIIRWTKSKQNTNKSDQLSKCKTPKILSHQKEHHMVGINIKPGTVCTVESTCEENFKIAFNFDDTLEDGHAVWQLRCMQKLSNKRCYTQAGKDSRRKSRQKDKANKRNHIKMLQDEQKNSAYIPVLFIRNDAEFWETIKKISIRIYVKKAKFDSFDFLLTIEYVNAVNKHTFPQHEYICCYVPDVCFDFCAAQQNLNGMKKQRTLTKFTIHHMPVDLVWQTAMKIIYINSQ